MESIAAAADTIGKNSIWLPNAFVARRRYRHLTEAKFPVDGGLRVAPLLTATVAADHRVSDGHRGGLFLAAVRDLLQNPAELSEAAL